MKISLQWLRTYLPDAPDKDACADALTHAGLPVETFEKYDGDDVFDVEVTSNRSDCLSHVGVARELGALLNLAVAEPPVDPPAGAVRPGELPRVTVEDPKLCPLYTARVLKGVKVGPSPAWLQRHLLAVGLRPINNVVDVTNFVLHEMGQPLHAFDLATLHGPEIRVRLARAGEKLVSLDGHTRVLEPWMLVIADAQRPVALAGIMGGKDTEVTEATTDILLESAAFDPLVTRRTSRSLSLRSDSSYRFERGLDPTLQRRASLRACRLICELAGGTLVEGESAMGRGSVALRRLTLRFEKLRRVLGYDIPRDAVVDALARLRMSPVAEAEQVRVTVPPDRLDIAAEIDLVEEVARLWGYGKIPERQRIEIELAPPDAAAKASRIVNDVAVGAGYYEAITFSFVSDVLAGDFVPAEASGLPRAEHGTRKADAQLRPSLLPGLLEALRRNEASGNGAVKLYEVGSVFWTTASGELVERRRVALVGGTDVAVTRGVVEAMLARLDAHRPVRVEPQPAPGYAVAGRVYWGETAVGTLGLVSKAVCDKLDLRHTPAAAELEMAPLLELARAVPQLVPLPKYPAVERDVSLVLADPVAYAQVMAVLEASRLPELERVDHVTTYRGKPLEKGSKSVTVRLVFRSREKSLRSEDVDAAVATFIERAKRDLGATLRV
ncbi:MAG: phenylalanine--tRNA ligase subunit beta [Tepidisphaerales bacterium]